MFRNKNYEHSYDDYELLKQIGEGGFAIVFKAKKKINQKIVAIKKITKTTKYTLDELNTMIDLSNDPKSTAYLVRLDGYFYHDDKLHLVMPFYEKGSLQDYVRGHHLNSESIVRILKHLVHGLQFLHSKGFVHRDLTPRNVLIKEVVDGKIRVLIADFGLTKNVGNGTMQTIVGTPGFMHPKVCRGKEYGSEVDIYSLGAVFYAMLTNSNPPNKRKKILENADQIVKDPVAFELLKEMLKIKNPILLEGILEHKYVKENQPKSSFINLPSQTKQIKPCLHRTVLDGKCLSCKAPISIEKKRSRKDSGLASDELQKSAKENHPPPLRRRANSDRNLATAEDDRVDSWPLEEFKHIATKANPVSAVCGEKGRIILRDNSLFFEWVVDGFIGYVVQIQQTSKRGFIEQTMFILEPISKNLEITKDEKDKKPVPCGRTIDTFTTPHLPAEYARCYKCIVKGLTYVQARIAKIDFVNIFEVKRLTAKLMYNNDFRMIFSNNRIVVLRSGGIKPENSEVMTKEEAEQFQKGYELLLRLEKVYVESLGVKHTPVRLQVDPKDGTTNGDNFVQNTDRFETDFTSSKKKSAESLPANMKPRKKKR